MVFSSGLEEAAFAAIPPVFGHLVVVAVLPFTVLLLNRRGIGGIMRLPAWLAANADTIGAASVAGKVAYHPFNSALWADPRFMVARSLEPRTQIRRMHALFTVRRTTVWPPLIAVKIGQSESPLACVADLRLLLVFILIKRLPLTAGPSVLTRLAPDIFAVLVASVIVKVVQRATEFAFRARLHSGLVISLSNPVSD